MPNLAIELNFLSVPRDLEVFGFFWMQHGIKFGFFAVAEVGSSLVCVGIFPPPYYLNNIENLYQPSKAFH